MSPIRVPQLCAELTAHELAKVQNWLKNRAHYSAINIYIRCIHNIKLENINHYFLLNRSDPASPCDTNHDPVISFNFILMIQHQLYCVLAPMLQQVMFAMERLHIIPADPAVEFQGDCG